MDTSARLKTVPLFASLHRDALDRVASLTTRRSYPKGSLLCREEEYGDTLYIIDSGEALKRQTDLRGVERPTAYLREGAVIGEDAVLLGDTYSYCVQATTDVTLLCIRKRDLDTLLTAHPRVRRQLSTSRIVKERLNVPAFPWLGKDEQALLLRKRHWIVFVRSLPLPIFLFLLLAGAAWLLRQGHSNTNLLLTVLWVCVPPVLLLLWYLIDWQNDFYLVTTQKIIHREKRVLFYETSDEAPLAKIQDTRILRDFLGKLLGYGMMRVETASARGSIVLDHLPDPEGLQEVIFNQVRFLKWKMQQEERNAIRAELLQGTRQAAMPEIPADPPQQPQQGPGILDYLHPTRPLLQMRYQQADRIVWRKHWVYLLRRITKPLLTFLFTVAIIGYLLYLLHGQYAPPLTLVALVLWIPISGWIWWEFEDWRNDEYILTNRLILDVEKKPLFFAEERRQATLDMIQNVSLHIPGPLASILNFGDVVIQTAGQAGTIYFRGVSSPAEVQSQIFSRIEAHMEAQRRREREQHKAEFSTWFQIYDELNREKPPPAST